MHQSASEIIRHQQEKMEIFRLIWSPALSPSMSIFIWRLLANRVPMDAKLQWRNIHLASKCRCCKNSSEETREHLFIQGATMAKIWRYFANWFPDAPEFPRDMTNIELRIRWWKSNAMQTTKEHVNILIPCLILWFIWTERNNVIHWGVIFSSGNVIERVQNHLQWAILARKIQGAQWKGSAPNVTFNLPQQKVNRAPQSRVVWWQLPQSGYVKINTDGAFAGVTFMAGGGGVIRND